MNWMKYYKRVGDKPNSLVVTAVQDFSTGRSAALDLGAGNLRDAKFLVQAGFGRVVAIDSDSSIESFAVTGIETVVTSIEDYKIQPDAFDFVIACNALFFISPKNMKALFDRVYRGLRLGGVFVFNVMGDEDEAVVTGRERAFGYTEKEISKLSQPFVSEGKKETRWTDRDTQKFWHTWSVILRK